MALGYLASSTENIIKRFQDTTWLMLKHSDNENVKLTNHVLYLPMYIHIYYPAVEYFRKCLF